MADPWWKTLLFGASGTPKAKTANPQLVHPTYPTYPDIPQGNSSSITEMILKALQGQSQTSPTQSSIDPLSLIKSLPTQAASVPNATSYTSPATQRYWDDPNKIPYGGQLGSTAGMAGYQADQAAQKAANQPTLQDQLLKQLLAGLNAGAPKTQSLRDIQKAVAAAINPAFDPQISSIQQLMADARKDSGVNAKDIKALYADLSGTYAQDATDNKAAIAEAQANEAKQLGALQGQTDALSRNSEGQRDDLDFFNTLNNTNSDAQQKFLTDMGLANDSYYTKSGAISQQRGNESVQTLLGNLDQYLKGEGSQITGLQGQKASAIQQAVQQQQTSQSSAASQWQSDQWNRMFQMLGLVNSQNQTQFSNSLDMAKLQAAMQGKDPVLATKGIQGATDLLDQLLGGNSGNAKSAFQNFLQSTSMRNGTFQSGGQTVAMNPQEAAYEARQYGMQQKLSSTEIDALVNAVYAYYNKLS